MITHFNWPNKLSMPVMYANRQWAVTKYGIECLTEDYPIERLRLAEKWPNGNLSQWVMHLSEKIWCDIREFTDCLEMGLELHRVKGRSMIDLGDSLTAALKKIEQNKKFDKFMNDIDPPKNDGKPRVVRMDDLIAAHDLYVEEMRKKRGF